MWAHFMLWEQFIRASLKAMRTLYISPLQRYGNIASLGNPDTCVRRPDCLHLTYTNLSDAEFKTMVIRMLTEMVEHGHKIEEKVKAMQSEIKKNIQGTNSDRKETRTQINSLEQKGKINIQPEQSEEKRIQKNEERLRNLQDIFKCSNIWIIGVPEGEEEEQEMENLSENIVKENVPNLAK